MRIAVLVAVLVVLSRLDQQGLLVSTPPDGAIYHDRTAEVVRVIDGDTLEILLPDRAAGDGTVTRVRIWGIDTPEAARFGIDAAPAEPWAAQATAFARERLDGREVLLRLEPHRTRGIYGRLLAHVYLPEGDNLAELLLAEGLAIADDRWDHAFIERFRQVESTARRNQVGLWSGPPPEADAADPAGP